VSTSAIGSAMTPENDSIDKWNNVLIPYTA
jgi:hypothetical protein